MEVIIKFEDVTDVPEIYLDGEKVNSLVRVIYDWNTDAEKINKKSIQIEYINGKNRKSKIKKISETNLFW